MNNVFISSVKKDEVIENFAKSKREELEKMIPGFVDDRKFYQVMSGLERAPLRDYLLHGYETRRDFEQALHRLVSLWRGRIGERIGERHGFFLLRFHDTPGGSPDEEWLPEYLLQPAGNLEPVKESDVLDDTRVELEQAYGFD